MRPRLRWSWREPTKISARDLIKSRLASFPATAVLLEHKALVDALLASVKGGCADLPNLIHQQGEGCRDWLIQPWTSACSGRRTQPLCCR